jgi:hypothetical protein
MSKGLHSEKGNTRFIVLSFRKKILKIADKVWQNFPKVQTPLVSCIQQWFGPRKKVTPALLFWPSKKNTQPDR